VRKLRKLSICLPSLTGQGEGGRAATRNIQRKEADPSARLTFPGCWTKPDVRGALIASHGRVCAYCQCDIRHAPSDVEHFRPKSVYWWLAYELDNYLLSCIPCNRSYKKERFPLPAGAGHWTYGDRDRLKEEKFVLLDPAVDDVEAWICVVLRDNSYFLLVPSPELIAGSETAQRVRETIDFFALNGKAIRQRTEAVGQALEALELAHNGDPMKAELVKKMASRFRPHGVAIRQFLEKISPELIPSPEQEFFNLILDLCDDLKWVDRMITENPLNQINRRYKEEVLWALAILWKFPPATSPRFVEDCLAEQRRRDEVAPYLNQF
jgi:uncharacterized protein (TIGR02646 family)